MKKSLKLILSVVLCMILCIGLAVPSFATTKTPAKPVITSAKQVSSSAIQIKWKKAKNAAKYEVYVSINSGSYKKVKTLTKLSFKHTGLKAGKTYKYRIRAINGKKKSKFSAIKTVKIPKKTPTPTPTPKVNITLPETPLHYTYISSGLDGAQEINITKISYVVSDSYNGSYTVKFYFSGKKTFDLKHPNFAREVRVEVKLKQGNTVYATKAFYTPELTVGEVFAKATVSVYDLEPGDYSLIIDNMGV